MYISTTRLFNCLIFVAVAASYGHNTTSICNALFSILPEQIFFPDSNTYNASITSYPFLQLQQHPYCIVRPKTAQDVSRVVSILRESHHTNFAVKGGGHNVNTGFNNIDDGVTIDMQSMQAVDVHGTVVQVGAGALWQQVYEAVEPHNITVMGGRIGVVGVAGFVTGGGISFWSPDKGWSCDSVLNFQVVLANGHIVNANATSHPDLYVALKGGQNNFGIVTRFDFQSFPSVPVWGGRIAYAPEADTALVDAFTEFKRGEYEPYGGGWITFRYNSSNGNFTPVSTLWYTKPESQPGRLGGMTGVQPQAMNGMQTALPSQFAKNASMVVKSATRYQIWATRTFHVSPTIVGRMHSLWKSLAPKICNNHAYAHPLSELSFHPVPPPPRNTTSRTRNSLGFMPEDPWTPDLAMLQIIFMYSDGRASADFNAALEDFVRQFDNLMEEEGVGHEFVYLNYAAAFQDPLGSYGKAELEKLKGVARRYDPRGVFQKQLVGGFKVFGGNGSYWT